MKNHLTKLDNRQVAMEIKSVVQRILLSFSEVTDKGRLIGAVEFSHIMHEVIPAEINKVLKGRQIFEEED